MNDVAVFKFDESAGEWNELSTTYSDADDTYYYYTVELNSFSYFAIGEKAVVESGSETDVTSTPESNKKAMWIIIILVLLAAVAAGWYFWNNKK